jgi:hypothetical protein
MSSLGGSGTIQPIMLVAVLWIIAVFTVLLVLAIPIGTFLRSHSSDIPAPPAWAALLPAQDYDHFVQRLRGGLQNAGLQSNIDNGIVSIVSQGTARQIPLLTFAQACRGKQRCDWDMLLKGELAKLIADSHSFDVSNFDRVKNMLRLQLGAAPGLMTNMMVGREDLPGVATILVLDLPGAVRTISPMEAVPWNQPMAELMRIGLDHIRGMPAPTIEEIELNERLGVFAVTGESPYIASNALLLEEYPKLIGPWGAIIAVPTRNILLSFPITSRAAGDALFPLAWIAGRRWKDGPGSITPRIYWYMSGRFVHLPYEFTGEKFSLHPPWEFAAMLESLRGNYR